MTTDALKLPTVISSSAILNAVVRGAEAAAVELGSDYFALVRKDFLSRNVAIYRRSGTSDAMNPLDPTQSLEVSDQAIWSTSVQDSALWDEEVKKNPLFQRLMLRYFFLNEEEALEYIAALEATVLKLAQDAIEKQTDDEEEN